MRIVFLGYGEIGATVLAGITAVHETALVVTHPTRFSRLNEPHVGIVAADLELPVLEARHAREEHVVEAVRAARPDVLVSANWRTIIPQHVLEIPALLPLNVHDALLPGYAGFGAVNWAIRNGESRTGLTVHVMDPELDTGPVLWQVTVPIDDDDTATTVQQRLLKEYPGAVLAALERAESGVLPVPQTAEGPSFYHRITEADTRIDWALPTRRLLDLVRAHSDPFVNAWCLSAGRKLYIKRAARPARPHRGTPGLVVRHTDGGATVTCGHSWEPGADGIVLLEVRPEDGPPVSATELLRPGHRLE
ncbi:methionyl-tRNA formyltransferase [Streptomyces sp. I05A-00742]|uniref:methionyl-tRNA formyltransferase n=1 Tax=Streptomyces sp. I05A-00742 TaxID=2732853 RepID=UPI00148A038A|nr:methionyl-tRNA formyltransferase [Streptomyces sp. I05A-00742]